MPDSKSHKNRKKHLGTRIRLLLAVPLFLLFFWATPALSPDKKPADTISPVSGSEILISPVPAQPDVAQSTQTPVPSPTPSPEPAFKEYDISLMALGDNLMHMGIVNTGKKKDGTYDFSFLFEDIADFLSRADIKIINQETIFAGNDLGFSGYPKFNSPTEVGDAIAAAGFNVVLHATNHAADQNIEGLINCASFWKKYSDILTPGIHEEEIYGEIPLLTIGDITFAILNYVYAPNAQVIDKSLQGHLDMLCDYDRQTGAIRFTALNPQVTEDIRTAKELADIVIVCPHWGAEYQSEPSKYQQKFAAEIAEAGADLIIGTHPHVPQPVEWLTTTDGRKVLCYYSLGNYVSTQDKKECLLGGMAWVTFHVTEDDIFIENETTGMLPIVCHYTCPPLRLKKIYLLEEYTEDLAVTHGIAYHSEEEVNLHLVDLEQQCSQTFGDMRLYRNDILQISSPDQALAGRRLLPVLYCIRYINMLK